MEPLVQLGGQLHRTPRLVQRNRLTNVVDDELTRIAVGQMLFQRLANCRASPTVDVIVQRGQNFFTGHGFEPFTWFLYLLQMRRGRGKLHFHPPNIPAWPCGIVRL